MDAMVEREKTSSIFMGSGLALPHGVGDEHLDILFTVADKMLDETAADRLATGDVDTVYRILTGKEQQI